MGTLESIVESNKILAENVKELADIVNLLQFKDKQDEVMTLEELQAFLQLGYSSTKELIARTDFPKVSVGSNRYRFLKSSVINYLQSVSYDNYLEKPLSGTSKLYEII